MASEWRWCENSSTPRWPPEDEPAAIGPNLPAKFKATPREVNIYVIFGSKACISSGSAMRKHPVRRYKNHQQFEPEAVIFANDPSKVILSTSARGELFRPIMVNL